MKEITPKELQRINDNSFKKTQKIFRRRLREIAADGHNKATYKPEDYCCGERIADWLKSLGFTVKQINPIWCEVTWPEEGDILEQLRDSALKILTKPVPCKLTWGVKVEREELGTWIFDSHTFDYVCSECGKHLGYTTPYCPICGKKLKPLEGTTYDKD